MIKTLLVCDDSTGANASGILLNQLNLKTLSIIHHEKSEFIEDYDAIAVSTDSRGIDKDQAYDRVKYVLEKFKDQPIDLFNKRVDSTLRGNIGSELNAFYETFPNRKIAIVPAYPNSGRTCHQGLVYVNDVSLEKTDVAKDPKMPIDTSNAKQLFKKQFMGSIDNIHRELYHDPQVLEEAILNSYHDHDAIIFDAINNDDVEMIAKVLVRLNIDVITVDPGYFTYVYAKQYMLKRTLSDHRFIYLVGSVTDTTYKQLKYIEDNEDFMMLAVCPNQLIESRDIDGLIQGLVKKIKASNASHIIVSTVDLNERKILDLKAIADEKKSNVDDISKIINNNLAKILSKIIDEVPSISGVFGSGGDTALSFLQANDAYGIELKNEVIPMCVYGNIHGGKYNCLPMITKGGMIGDEDAYMIIKRFFEEEIDYE
jgi:uncharacterized protein YgbK (DUF1537 family)